MALLRIFIVFILGLFVINNGYSQSLNMSKLYQYDNNSLPTFSGFAYSDIWGYYTQDGKEIAFIGSLDSIHFLMLHLAPLPINLIHMLLVEDHFGENLKRIKILLIQ